MSRLAPSRTGPRVRRLILASAIAAVGASFLMPDRLFAETPEPVSDVDMVDLITSMSEAGLTPDQIRAMMAARSGMSSSASDDGLPSADKVTKGLAKADNDEGQLFSVWYAADPAAAEPGKILAEVPASLLGRDLLLATTVGSGPLAGLQWDDYLVRMERRGKNVVLVVPDLRNRGSGTVGEAVQRTYRERILVTLPVRAKGSGTLLVDLKPLTLGSAIRVPSTTFSSPALSRHTKVKAFPENVLIEAERAGSTGVPQVVSFSFRKLPGGNGLAGGYRPRVADERVGYFMSVAQDWSKPFDARETVERFIHRWNLQKLDESLEKSPPREPIVFYIEKSVPVRWRQAVRDGIAEWNKAFEERCGIVGAIEIRQQTDTAYANIDPEDARYNFFRWIVSDTGFAIGPSRVDPRTGQILDADILVPDSFTRGYQSQLDVLGPKTAIALADAEQMMFWLEHPGFMPAGVTEADIRESMSELDPSELYAAAGSNFGISEADPNAGVDARNRIAESLGLAGRNNRIVASRTSGAHGACSHAEGLCGQLALAQFAHNASLIAAASDKSVAGSEAADELEEQLAELADKMGAEMPEELTAAIAKARAEAEEAEGDADESASADDEAKEEAAEIEETPVKIQPLPDKYVALMLRQLVAHEVGHTLGLRHNFKASSWLTVDEIRERRKDATQPTSASVMDYNPLVLFAGDDPGEVETFASPVIGPYDYWAIEYGYKILPRRTERQKLDEIASQSGKPEYAYASDEDARGGGSIDPAVNLFDMGKDPIEWARTRNELANEMLETVDEWSQGDNERSEFLRRAFSRLMFEKAINHRYVARMVGGQHMSRSHPSDKIEEGAHRPGLTPLTAAEQREALAFLAETVFADGYFDVEADLLHRVHRDRLQGKSGFGSVMGRIDFPAHASILRLQDFSLATLTDPQILQRVYDAEIKAAPEGDEEPFTANELIVGVSDAVWGQETDELLELDSIRRNLQQQHLQYLLAAADSEPGRLMSADLRNQVRQQVRTLKGRIDEALEDGIEDAATLAHLAESKDRIAKVLDAPYIKGGTGGGSTVILMMGQEQN